MSDLYNRIMSLCDNAGISGYRLCKDAGIQPSVLTDLKMGRQLGLSAKNADKIASYFGVSVGYLLGTEQKKDPTQKREADYKELKLLEEYKKLNDIGRVEAVKRVSELAQIPKYQSGLSEVRAIARSGYTETTYLTKEEEKELERLTAELDEKLKDNEFDL